MLRLNNNKWWLQGEVKLLAEWPIWVADKVLRVVASVNPEIIVESEKNQKVEQFLLDADVWLPDGWAGLRFLFWRWGIKGQRCHGADVVAQWLQSNLGIKTLLLGARDNDADLLAKKIDPQGKWLRGIAGHSNALQPTVDEDKAIQAVLEEWRPQVVLVAFGAPKQEEWVLRWRAPLAAAGVRIVMTIGGSLDYLTGRVRRAPLSWQKLHVEWLWRLIQEPWRWRRQLKIVRALKLLGRSRHA